LTFNHPDQCARFFAALLFLGALAAHSLALGLSSPTAIPSGSVFPAILADANFGLVMLEHCCGAVSDIAGNIGLWQTAGGGAGSR
jgi:hypothetical protein